MVEDKINEIKEESMRKEEFQNKERKNLQEIIKALEEKMQKEPTKEEEWMLKEESCKEKIRILTETLDSKKQCEKDEIDKLIKKVLKTERHEQQMSNRGQGGIRDCNNEDR